MLRSLSSAGFSVFCLDWGEPVLRDRDLTWREMVGRVLWARDQVAERTGRSSLAVAGFSLGGTLSVIAAALRPEGLTALVNLSGPVDFDKAGVLSWLADARWFDPAIPSAWFWNTPSEVLQAHLMLHRIQPARLWLDHFGPSLQAASYPLHELCETWVQHHVPLPPHAFQTYVRDLIQQNRLVRGTHHVYGKPARLDRIRCPVLAVGARHDAICRPEAVTVLADACGSPDATSLVVPGGHLGSIMGRRADRTLHAPVIRWISEHSTAARGPSDGATSPPGVQPPS